MDIVRINNLYDQYKELLTEKQQEYFESYYFNNLSLAEISVNYKVSRNAIHKQLKDIESKLEDYESKLKLSFKNKSLLKIIEETDNADLKKELERIL